MGHIYFLKFFGCVVFMVYLLCSNSKLWTINTQGMPWCRICHTRGHHSEECLYLHNIVSAPTSLYCKFCKSVGHDEKDFRAFQLLHEKIVDTYLMKNEEHMQDERDEYQYPQDQYPQKKYP